MHVKPNQADDPAIEDRRAQAAVLDHVLALRPDTLSLTELLNELCGERPAFAERDRIERAIRDLAGVGLLRTACELVLPTRAAVVFDALRQEG